MCVLTALGGLGTEDRDLILMVRRVEKIELGENNSLGMKMMLMQLP